MNDPAFVSHVQEHLKQEKWDELCILLDERFKVNPREIIPAETIQLNMKTLCDLLHNQRNHLVKCENYNGLNVIKHLLKALRNSVAYCSSQRIEVVCDDCVLYDAFDIITFSHTNDHVEAEHCVKMALQFLINATVGNVLSTNRVSPMFDLLKRLLNNPTYCYYTAALLYNMFLVDPNLSFQNQFIFKDIFDLHHEQSSNEYLMFLVEYFIKNERLSKTYVTYESGHRISYLKLAKELLDRGHKVTEDVVDFLCDEFKKKSDCILKAVTDHVNRVEPHEVFLLLEVLATISGQDGYTARLQKDTSLLITCAYLLQSIHQLGKQSDNCFTPLQKLSDLKDIDDDDFNHPTFGFKAYLIRIIGNLAWKNKSTQDEIRNLGSIPLMLDCCNIDARNPLIMQWAIFAIRNICENNLENQNVIASMSKQGVVSSETLREMGMTLEDDGKNRIIIAPLDLKH